MTDAMFTHMFGSSPDADDPIGYLLQQCYEGAITEDALNAAAKQHREATDQRKRDRDAVAGMPQSGVFHHDLISRKAVLAILDTPPAPVPAPASEPCGGCGAASDKERCLGCLHDFGTPESAWLRPSSPPPSAAPTDSRNAALRAIGVEPWPPIKKAIWDVLMEARLNVGYIAAKPLTEKLHEAVVAAAPTDDTALVEAAKAEFEKWIAMLNPKAGERQRVEWNLACALRERVAEAMTAALAIRPAAPAEGDVGAPDDKLDWFMRVMASVGFANSTEHRFNWINAFCNDRGDDDDTFNLALDRGLIRSWYDGDTDHGECEITDAGKAYAAALRPQSSAQGGER